MGRWGDGVVSGRGVERVGWWELGAQLERGQYQSVRYLDGGGVVR